MSKIKATVEKIGDYYEVFGLNKASAQFQNGKETYSYHYLHTFGGKYYKTLENAVKAITKKVDFEYIPLDTINLVCDYD